MIKQTGGNDQKCSPRGGESVQVGTKLPGEIKGKSPRGSRKVLVANEWRIADRYVEASRGCSSPLKKILANNRGCLSMPSR
jgi:hypothetical protein